MKPPGRSQKPESSITPDVSDFVLRSAVIAADETDQFREAVKRVELYWLVVNQSPLSAAIEALQGMNAPVHSGIEKEAPHASPGRLRVMLVEDNRADAELILATLKRAGYQLRFDIVDESGAYQDRLRRDQYDLILCDHNLQSWTGMDALDFVRAGGKDIPFITVTATLGDEAAVEYIRRGATNYVLKHNLDRLPIAVGEALREAAHRKESARLQEQISCDKREWELTFDAVPDPVLVIGTDCRIQRANYAARKVFGRPLDQIIGKPCYEVVHARTDPLPSCPHQCLLNTGQNAQRDIEEAHIGKIFYSSTSPLRDPDGSLRGCVHVLRDVTERKRTEEALRLQALTFENIHDAVMIVGKDDNIADWNPAATRIFGYEKHEIIGKKPLLLHRPEAAEVEFRALSNSVAATGRWEGEIIAVHKDGSQCVIETVIAGMRDEHGCYAGHVGVSRDITERKRAENALRESEQQFRMLLDSTAEAIYGLDLDGNCTFCNPACLRLLGYRRVEDLLGKNMHRVMHHSRPDGTPYPVEECRIFKAFSMGTPGHADDEVLWRADGTSFPAEYWSYPICRDGRLVGSVVTFLDITERKRAEEALRNSEEKYRDVFEHATYGIFRSTQDGNLLDVNPAFVSMLGYGSKEEVLTLNLSRDVYKNPTERQDILNRYDKTSKRVDADAQFRRKDGSTISVKISARAVRNSAGDISHFEVIAEDVSQQRTLEEQLRQAQKMEAVGCLAGGIAHDFNNVLMVISGYAEMILAGKFVDQALRRYTDHIIKAVQKAGSLINQLLAFSRKQILQPTILDLATVVRDTDKMLSRILGEDVEISIVTEPGLGRVHADRTQIEQVLMNLAVNARDAMPTGGKLRIELQNVVLGGDYIASHRSVKPGEYVLIAVSDNGTGMDSAVQARIFEPFFTTKPVGKGTGLGLAMVYGTVKQSGGFIWVYSEPGLGSTFKVYLPLVHADATAAPEPVKDTQDGMGNGETVLLVDDDAALRSAAREFLEARGFRVLEAVNGADALAICSKGQGYIQALVTDLVMPGMRGAELAATISKLYPQVKTVFMSGYTDHSEDIADLGPRATFLQKPFSLNTLVQTLHAALRGSTSTQ